MTGDQHTDHISSGERVSRHSLPTLQHFLFSPPHIFFNSILASRTFGTFGFARHTNRPFTKPKEPNLLTHTKKILERHTLAFHASTFVTEIRNKESMQTNNSTLSPTTDRPFELAKTSAKMTISEVFAE